MHRQTLGLEQPFIASGAVIVAGDAALTVLAGTQSLHVICQNICQNTCPDTCPDVCPGATQHTMCCGRGHSLASCLPSSLSAQLYAHLRLGQAQCQMQWVSELGQSAERPTCLHVSASRVEGLTHQGQLVYHLVFSDVSTASTLLHQAELEKKKYAVIAEITEDIPFEYNFGTDTMVFAEKYSCLFGESASIVQFCQRVVEGENADDLHVLLCKQLADLPECGESVLECHVRTIDGNYRWFLLLCKGVKNAQGKVAMAVGAIRNIDKQKLEQLQDRKSVV